MSNKSKPLWILFIAALLATLVCALTVFYVRNGIGQDGSQYTMVKASSKIDENQKIREAIAKDFLESIHDNQPEGDGESDYEPLTLPPDGETFSFDLND